MKDERQKQQFKPTTTTTTTTRTMHQNDKDDQSMANGQWRTMANNNCGSNGSTFNSNTLPLISRSSIKRPFSLASEREHYRDQQQSQQTSIREHFRTARGTFRSRSKTIHSDTIRSFQYRDLFGIPNNPHGTATTASDHRTTIRGLFDSYQRLNRGLNADKKPHLVLQDEAMVVDEEEDDDDDDDDDHGQEVHKSRGSTKSGTNNTTTLTTQSSAKSTIINGKVCTTTSTTSANATIGLDCNSNPTTTLFHHSPINAKSRVNFLLSKQSNSNNKLQWTDDDDEGEEEDEEEEDDDDEVIEQIPPHQKQQKQSLFHGKCDQKSIEIKDVKDEHNLKPQIQSSTTATSLSPLDELSSIKFNKQQQNVISSSTSNSIINNIQTNFPSSSAVVAASVSTHIPTEAEKAQFQRSLDSATSLVFHRRSGLPLTSSPHRFKPIVVRVRIGNQQLLSDWSGTLSWTIMTKMMMGMEVFLVSHTVGSVAPIRKSGTSFDFDSSLTSVNAIKKALFQKESDVRDSIYSLRSRINLTTPTTTSTLLGNFEESVLNGRLEPASINTSRDRILYALQDSDKGEKISSPYLGHINLGPKGYHVPRQGTVQVTLFNPNGTVVKMFVVRYNLSDMPPNSRTFLRQRTLFMPSDATEHHADNRKWLRYLIHLRFQSSKSGRIRLHTDIRILVFRKHDLDVATLNGGVPYELRSFVQMPSNPKYSKNIIKP
ncbi:hypothetical protein BLOT_001628 [Blomia tropicalis]|nr:hypothetical protein BLOT_001628 [Blomia tropicalis]